VSRGSKYPASPLECNVSQGGHIHSPDSLENRPITCTLKFLLTTTTDESSRKIKSTRKRKSTAIIEGSHRSTRRLDFEARDDTEVNLSLQGKNAPTHPDEEDNGLFFRPLCMSACMTLTHNTMSPCHRAHTKVDHVTLNNVGDYVLFQSMPYH
jgi:hypothetical protein